MTKAQLYLRSAFGALVLGSALPARAQSLEPSAVVASAVSASTAQPAPEQEVEDEAVEEEITVVGRRDPNAVIGDIPPENQLSPRDIRAYGASSISELLDALAPQLGSSRGRGGEQPVVLLNGRRISGFREVRDLPPEAILRLDILPEEVALKYGYRADQRVVNVVLRPRFRSTSVRLQGRTPTDGETMSGEGDVTHLLLGENGRTTLNAHVEGNSALTEAERDIDLDPNSNEPVDPRPFRTLIGERRLARVGGTINRTLFGDVSSTFDAQVERSDGRSLLGPSLFSLGDPLARESDSLSGHLGVAFNGQKERWRWSLTGNYDVARTETDTERERANASPFIDRARSLSRVGNLDLTLNGPLIDLPAGRATTTIRIGGDTRDLDSRTRRADLVSETDLGRDEVSASMNVDLPIAKRNGPLAALGNLSLNANAEMDYLSDFGTLTVLGAGVYWSPAERLNLIASWTREEGPPSLQQIGDPILVTPESRIFDFTTGETVLVDAVSGGNPNLDSDRRNVVKLGANWRPFQETDLILRADFVRTRIDNPISGFPGVTEAIEAAFPERFLRDSAGNLVLVDLRPVNFESSARDELRWGFNYTKPLASARPPQSFIDRIRQLRQQQGRDGASGAEGPPPERREGAGQRRGPGGGGFGGGRRQGGRLQFSVYHTWVMKDEVRIAQGLPTLDFLDGEVIEGGFRPRHKIEADAGYFNNGLGARLSADWQSGGALQGGDGDGDLDFGSLAKFNLNLFANLGERFELIEKHPWLRGTQVRFGVQNIFNAKQEVRDAFGEVPFSYQPDLLDPQGRTISISIRKLFSPRPVFGQRGQGSNRS
jgi:hypothetical protein